MKKVIATLVQLGPLTKTEARVLRYLCEGYTRGEIAVLKMVRSPSTVNRHVESIALKLDAHSQAEIVSIAIAGGLIYVEFKESVPPLLARCLLILLMFNVTAGHIDYRSAPRAPRPVRTYRTSTRLLRGQREYP